MATDRNAITADLAARLLTALIAAKARMDLDRMAGALARGNARGTLALLGDLERDAESARVALEAVFVESARDAAEQLR